VLVRWRPALAPPQQCIPDTPQLLYDLLDVSIVRASTLLFCDTSEFVLESACELEPNCAKNGCARQCYQWKNGFVLRSVQKVPLSLISMRVVLMTYSRYSSASLSDCCDRVIIDEDVAQTDVDTLLPYELYQSTFGDLHDFEQLFELLPALVSQFGACL